MADQKFLTYMCLSNLNKKTAHIKRSRDPPENLILQALRNSWGINPAQYWSLINEHLVATRTTF
jgi:hypothetical protein